jgi:hypothetical protein
VRNWLTCTSICSNFWSEGFPHCFSPAADSLNFRRGKFCLLVHEQILPLRHFAFRYVRTQSVQQFLLLLWRVRIPLREVHPAPSCMNVISNEPRRWCHAAIPQPHSAIGVAVIARPFKNRSHGWCQWKTRAKLPRGVDRRISPGRTDDLSSHDENNEGHNHPLHPDQNVTSVRIHFHCRFVLPLASFLWRVIRQQQVKNCLFALSGQYKKFMYQLTALTCDRHHHRV